MHMYQTHQAPKHAGMRVPGQPLSYSTKNMYMPRKHGPDLSKDRDTKPGHMLSSSQVHLSTEHTAGLD